MQTPKAKNLDYALSSGSFVSGNWVKECFLWFICLIVMGQFHPQRPRGSQSGWEKRCNERFQAQIKKPQILLDHFQTVKWMLAPDWLQKMLCIFVPNRRTASPEFFSCVCTQWLLPRQGCACKGNFQIRNEGPTDELKKHCMLPTVAFQFAPRKFCFWPITRDCNY